MTTQRAGSRICGRVGAFTPTIQQFRGDELENQFALKKGQRFRRGHKYVTHWHHLLPQEVFNTKLLKELGLESLDIGAAEFGHMLQGRYHIGEGGLHPQGWNKDWLDWIDRQKKAGVPITEDRIRQRLKTMMKSEKYASILAKGKAAEMCVKTWSNKEARELEKRALREMEEHLAEKKVVKELAEKGAKELVEKGAEKGVGRGLKKGAGFLARKTPIGILFFAYDYFTGGPAYAASEAIWPLPDIIEAADTTPPQPVERTQQMAVQRATPVDNYVRSAEYIDDAISWLSLGRLRLKAVRDIRNPGDRAGQ